VSIDIQLIKGN